jgi:8-oxo-dGTP pyrophosphatase MutT (NUDIX family)
MPKGKLNRETPAIAIRLTLEETDYLLDQVDPAKHPRVYDLLYRNHVILERHRNDPQARKKFNNGPGILSAIKHQLSGGAHRSGC